MGNPYFYVYYTDSGPLTSHDFGRSISDLYPRPVRARVDARGGDGAVSSAVGPAGMRVVVRRERTSDQSLVRAWRNVEDHLLVGGRVGFSWDHARSWAGYASLSPTEGDTLLYTGGNAFSAWSAAAALSSTDEIVIESPNPEGRREYTTVSAYAVGRITVPSVLNTYTAKPMVRWAGFFPALYLPEDQLDRLRISADRNITWNLDFELEVDVRIFTAAEKSGILSGGLDLRAGGVKPGGAGRSLEGLLSGGSIAGSRAGSAMFASLYKGR